MEALDAWGLGRWGRCGRCGRGLINAPIRHPLGRVGAVYLHCGFLHASLPAGHTSRRGEHGQRSLGFGGLPRTVPPPIRTRRMRSTSREIAPRGPKGCPQTRFQAGGSVTRRRSERHPEQRAEPSNDCHGSHGGAFRRTWLEVRSSVPASARTGSSTCPWSRCQTRPVRGAAPSRTCEVRLAWQRIRGSGGLGALDAWGRWTRGGLGALDAGRLGGWGRFGRCGR